MDEVDSLDPAYAKGFNQGYFIAKEMPELKSSLYKTEGNSQQLEGIKHGIEQFEKENEKSKEEKLPDWIRRDRLAEFEKENLEDLDLDKEDYEKE